MTANWYLPIGWHWLFPLNKGTLRNGSEISQQTDPDMQTGKIERGRKKEQEIKKADVTEHLDMASQHICHL